MNHARKKFGTRIPGGSNSSIRSYTSGQGMARVDNASTMDRAKENAEREVSINWMNTKNNATDIVVAMVEKGLIEGDRLIILKEIQEVANIAFKINKPE